jgi:hypothetical protein
MKKAYDFSKGERGKFYHPDAEFHLPVYLEPDIAEFMQAISAKKQVEIETIVNDWLRKDRALIQTAQ